MSRPRKKNVGIYLLATIILILFGYSFFQSSKTVVEKDLLSEYQTKEISINDQKIKTYLADTDEKQRLGLSIFSELGRDEGMLFEYQSPQKPAFWMKDMKLDIDIVWILNNTIVGITPDLSHFSPSVKYYPEQDIDTVLEVNAGYCKRNKVEVGNEVKFN